MAKIDIVIISHAKNECLAAITRRCVESLIASEAEGYFNITVVESGKAEETKGVRIIQPQADFNYNRYCNLGAKYGNCEWICFCNNDLIFHKGWASALIKFAGKNNIRSMSPKCDITKRQKNLNGVHNGYKTGLHISGWCIMMHRNLWTEIGGLDEDVLFWCSDDAYREQLKAINEPHYLVCDSVVTHLGGGSNTLNEMKDEIKQFLTTEQIKIYRNKYKTNARIL